jgi:simple sugar transport system ATP-binding protein
LRGVTKSYGSTQALLGVELECRSGEVVALLGQNGAGKSTAARIASGMELPDSGCVELDGRAVQWRTAREARQAGVYAVAQELAQTPDLPLEEALHLGRLPRWGPWVDRRRLREASRQALARVGLTLDPRSRLGDHSAAVRALVAIAAALDVEPRVLLLDEPTASLDRAQAAQVIECIRKLRHSGVGLVYIGHRLEEVLQVADHIVVLRDGRVVLNTQASAVSVAVLAAAIVGTTRDSAPSIAASNAVGSAYPTPPPARLVARCLSSSAPLLSSSFDVQPQRILGVAGLLGSGRSELCRTLAGVVPRQGQLTVDGQSIPQGVARTMDYGLVHSPEERRHEGLWLDLTIAETIALGLVRRGVRRQAVHSRQVALELVQRLRIHCASVDAPVRSLSGGNQQKVLLARLLAAGPAVLVLDEPTRGVDVGARADIVARVREVCGAGACVVWTTSYLEELAEVADDVLIVRDHAVVEQAAHAAKDVDLLIARLVGAE